MRLHPITGELELHLGIDIANQVGTPIYATADGVVDAVAHEEGLGKFIRLNHAKGYQTIYGHLLSFRVKPAEQVRKGQIIALMGNTGLSTGPHLHYGVRKGGQPVNPASYLNRLDDRAFATR
jgi:murein DD-endopeptidase MepM/ murein hydrolase activator NlpD